MDDSRTRMAWASDSAKAVWEPRVQAVQRAWLDVELRSVAAGVRLAALVFSDPATVVGHGLVPGSVAPGRLAVGRDARTVDLLQRAYAARDDIGIGRLLGFPPCCRSFFNYVWNTEQARDTTLHMHGDGRGPVEANILGRWLGVRLVPHLPCSWTCGPTIAFAHRLEPLWSPVALAWAREILAWSMLYSALHGIAIVTMPVLKVVASTDYTPDARTIRRDGTVPADAPHGLAFPFPRSSGRLIAINSLRRTDATAWTDNGFPSRDAMDHAHAMVLAALPAGAHSVLDLGCGNGVLMEKTGRVAVGIESDAARAARGQAAGRDIRVATIRDVVRAGILDGTFDVALISARRLEEMPAEDRAAFDAWLPSVARTVVLYSYDEPQFARAMPCI